MTQAALMLLGLLAVAFMILDTVAYVRAVEGRPDLRAFWHFLPGAGLYMLSARRRQERDLARQVWLEAHLRKPKAPVVPIRESEDGQ